MWVRAQSNTDGLILYTFAHMSFKRNKSISNELLQIKVDGVEIPLRVYREHRRNWRIALGQKAVFLRIPSRPVVAPSDNPLDWAHNWVLKKYRQQPELFQKYLLNAPTSGTTYDTIFGKYILQLEDAPRSTATGKVRDHHIEIKVPQSWGIDTRAEVLPKLISKLLAGTLHGPFLRRVLTLNEQHFGYIIEGISFKYNRSNWGSCSYDGRLTFSTRLFLAPASVADYVIIHELAHLEEHNHSPAFWNLVRDAMPNYKEHVAWLKREGYRLYY